MAEACWAQMALRPTSNLLSTAVAKYKSVPTMPWMRLLPCLYSAGLVSSSGVSCSWTHISLHDVCEMRAVVCVVGGVHIWWSTCLCIHSWICGRFYWSSVQYISIHGLSPLISSLPSRMLSHSAAQGFLVDVVRAASWHIWCQNNPLSRQIGSGAIYGARYQVSWMPRSSPPSWVVYAASHWQFFWTCGNL